MRNVSIIFRDESKATVGPGLVNANAKLYNYDYIRVIYANSVGLAFSCKIQIRLILATFCGFTLKRLNDFPHKAIKNVPIILLCRIRIYQIYKYLSYK